MPQFGNHACSVVKSNPEPDRPGDDGLCTLRARGSPGASHAVEQCPLPWSPLQMPSRGAESRSGYCFVPCYGSACLSRRASPLVLVRDAVGRKRMLTATRHSTALRGKPHFFDSMVSGKHAGPFRASIGSRRGSTVDNHGDGLVCMVFPTAGMVESGRVLALLGACPIRFRRLSASPLCN